MKILHYSLGFPPYRSGGLTKFCIDLAREQMKAGHDVSLLWPGKISLFSQKTKIRKRKDVDGIHSYELINPTPVPYDEGILEVAPYLYTGEASIYQQFLSDLAPDVIHIHTFMGIHESFLKIAKASNIHMCFTTHDFFPICPKVILFRDGHVCDTAESCMDCSRCNSSALSLKSITILQSPIYRFLKESALVKKLRKAHRDEYLREQISEPIHIKQNKEDYIKLRKHFEYLLSLVDDIHFNSELTKSIYEKFYSFDSSCIIPITHSDIKGVKKQKTFGHELRIAFLGQQSLYKGYYVLRDALDRLWKTNQNFELHVFFKPEEEREYIISHDRYSYNQLESILKGIDLVAIPSVCYETFGFTALESMSFGVPVLVSNNVGAKSIIPEGGGIVLDGDTVDELYSSLKSLTPEKLTGMHEVLCKTEQFTMQEMCETIIEKCYQVS